MLRLAPSLPMETRLQMVSSLHLRIQRRKPKVSAALYNLGANLIPLTQSLIAGNLLFHSFMWIQVYIYERIQGYECEWLQGYHQIVSILPITWHKALNLSSIRWFVYLLESIKTILSIHTHFQSHLNSNSSIMIQPIHPSLWTLILEMSMLLKWNRHSLPWRGDLHLEESL